jgi:hypothetical protein
MVPETQEPDREMNTIEEECVTSFKGSFPAAFAGACAAIIGVPAKESAIALVARK